MLSYAAPFTLYHKPYAAHLAIIDLLVPGKASLFCQLFKLPKIECLIFANSSSEV